MTTRGQIFFRCAAALAAAFVVLSPASREAVHAQNGPPTGRGPDHAPGQQNPSGMPDQACETLLGLPNLPEAVMDRCRQVGSSTGISRGDFNGDGIGDLAIGVPGERFGPDATNILQGAVYVLYGSPAGLTATGSQFISERDTSDDFFDDGIASGPYGRGPQNGARLGSALAAGDFNSDGFSDLAVGAPLGTGRRGICGWGIFPRTMTERCDDQRDAGLVWVFWGGPTGLNLKGSSLEPTALQFPGDLKSFYSLLHPTSPDYFRDQNVTAIERGMFGSSLAWGDFDGDGHADLAVGVPRARVLMFDGITVRRGGAVVIFYGSTRRFRDVRDTTQPNPSFAVYPGRYAVLTQTVNAALGNPAQDGDEFGASLTGGDFDNDSYTDLAVGVPREDIGAATDAGLVELFYGSRFGLRKVDSVGSARATYWSQNTTGIADTSEAGDRFGFSVAAGDFNGDGFRDLAIGAPFERLGTVSEAGGVHVLYGSITGIRATGSQFWNQNNPDLGQSPGLEDRFGFALATGDFNGDGRSDLAIGVPGEMVLNVLKAGLVHVIHGSQTGLNATTFPSQRWTQTPQRGEGVEAGDQFGYALSSWNFGGSITADLAVGVPFEDVGAVVDAGMVHVIYSGAPGVGLSGPAGHQVWTQASPGLPSRPLRRSNMFGFTAY